MSHNARADSASPAQQLLYLESIDRHIPAIDVDRSAVAVVITEDTCWRFAHDDWSRRRPRPWQRARRARWRAAGEALRTKRDRIRDMAAELGLIQ